MTRTPHHRLLNSARAAALLLAPLAAAAQQGDGLTLYGRVDMFVGEDNNNQGASNGRKVKVADSGGLSGSRLGVRGGETLGDGWRARFVLEQGINLDDGTLAQGGRGWGRQATVGVSGPFGSVDLGRRESAYYDFRNGFVAIITTAAFDPVGAVFTETNTGRVTVAGGVRTSDTNTTSGNIANTAIDGNSASAPGDYTTRYDNYIHYESPRFGPLQVALGVGVPEDKRAVASTQGQGTEVLSATVNLRGDSWRVSLATQSEKYRTSITSAGVAQGRAEKTVTALGVGYDFGALRVAAFINQDEFVAVNGTKDKATEWAAGVTVPVGAFSIDAMVAEGKIKGVAAKASGFGLVVRYDLSKRTDLYAGHRSNRDDNSPTTGATVRIARVKDTLTGVGIRHRF
jgi:general bacterial porin, GBP family